MTHICNGPAGILSSRQVCGAGADCSEEFHRADFEIAFREWTLQCGALGMPHRRETNPVAAKSLTEAFRGHVQCRRRGGKPLPVDFGYAVRLELSEPIAVPLTLGYAAHFGLGRYRPIVPESAP